MSNAAARLAATVAGATLICAAVAAYLFFRFTA